MEPGEAYAFRKSLRTEATVPLDPEAFIRVKDQEFHWNAWETLYALVGIAGGWATDGYDGDLDKLLRLVKLWNEAAEYVQTLMAAEARAPRV